MEVQDRIKALTSQNKIRLARVIKGDVNSFISTVLMRNTKKNAGLLYRKEEELSTNDSKRTEMFNDFFSSSILKRSTLN